MELVHGPGGSRTDCTSLLVEEQQNPLADKAGESSPDLASSFETETIVDAGGSYSYHFVPAAQRAYCVAGSIGGGLGDAGLSNNDHGIQLRWHNHGVDSAV